MSQSLFELVAGVLNMSSKDLTTESGPASLGTWDSLAHIAIVTAAEQTYGIRLTMPEILSIRSIANLHQMLEKHGVKISDNGGSR